MHMHDTVCGAILEGLGNNGFMFVNMVKVKNLSNTRLCRNDAEAVTDWKHNNF